MGARGIARNHGVSGGATVALRRGMKLVASSLGLVAALLGSADVQAARPDGGCITHEHFAEANARRRVLPPAPVLLAGAEKLVRDAQGPFPPENVRTSENFVVKWGPDATYAAATVDRMLVGFEDAWREQIVRMGHPAPTGMETYRLNVYIGNSGGSAPQIPDYAGGYATIDTEGYPFIVMSPGLMEYFAIPEYAPYGDGTSVHEFFHTVQFGTGAYNVDDSYWYWEATAEWASAETYPQFPEGTGYFIGAFAMYPHVSLPSYDYPDQGTLIELHHYGAQIFPMFVTEKIAGWEVIRDSWTLAGPNDDPIAVLDGLLAPLGEDVQDVYARFAAHMAAWDFAAGASYAASYDGYADAYPDEDHRIAVALDRDGTRGLVEAPADTHPEALGYNLLRMLNPARKNWTMRVEGDAAGSRGTASAFRATAVLQYPDSVEYIPLASEDADGRILTGEVATTGRETALYLVVTAQPASRDGRESFGYRYEISAEGDSPAACGCSLEGPGDASRRARFAGALAVALLGLLVAGRPRARLDARRRD